MRLIRIFLFSLLFYSGLVQSCSPSDSSKIVSELENSFEISHNFKRIIFIPYRGCSNCVAKAFDYLRNNSLDKDLVVFINYASEKEVKIRLNVFNIHVPNSLFIDEASKLAHYGLSSYYPTIIEFEENRSQMTVANPSNLEVWDRFSSVESNRE